MVNLYDACKETGLETKYDNHFFYDKEYNKIIVIGLSKDEIDSKKIKTILTYIENGIALEIVKVSKKGEAKEYQALEEYMMRGTRMITNKNPVPVDQKRLEELVEKETKRRKGQKAIVDLNKIQMYTQAVNNGIQMTLQKKAIEDELRQAYDGADEEED